MSILLDSFEQRWATRELTRGKVSSLVVPWLVFVATAVCIICVFAIVPDERVMGAVQRVFYFHVGAAIATYVAVGGVFAGSCLYLMRRRDIWDAVASSGASVALLFATQVLATGMIWGHSAWNVWWRWEPRLVSFLILWLLLLGYVLLRALSSSHTRQRSFAAIIGIVTAINVPIVVYSVKLLQASEQLHPQVVAKQGLRDGSYVATLVLCILTMSCFAFWLLICGVRRRMLEEELLAIRRGRGDCN